MNDEQRKKGESMGKREIRRQKIDITIKRERYLKKEISRKWDCWTEIMRKT